MLNPPERFPEELLRVLLADRWNLRVGELEYLPVGFGTHHWAARGTDGARWFVNVDELPADPVAAQLRFRQLGNALGVARTLRDQGHGFAVAPEPAADGGVVARLGTAFAVSVYAHLDGESFAWGEWDHHPDEHRAAILGILAELHAVPAGRRGPADADDFVLPERAGLERLLADDGAATGGTGAGRTAAPPAPAGPYTDRALALLSTHATAVRRMLRHYDALADLGRSHPERFVLTHGEPHPGNMMVVGGRHLLIDWESARLAPPERDLWNFGLGDEAMRELYAVRWDLAEVALYMAQFLRPHRDTDNERLSWKGLGGSLAKLETAVARI